MEIRMEKIKIMMQNPNAFNQFWPHLSPDRWPGKEIKFVLTHPLISLVLLFCFVSEIITIIVWGV